jgi:hypothetical protein
MDIIESNKTNELSLFPLLGKYQGLKGGHKYKKCNYLFPNTCEDYESREYIYCTTDEDDNTPLDKSTCVDYPTIPETNYINYKNNAINKNKTINKSLIMNKKPIPAIKNFNFIINSKILYNINNNCKTIKSNNIFCDNNIISNKRKLNTQFNFFSNDINYKSPLLKHKMQKNLAINNKGN